MTVRVAGRVPRRGVKVHRRSVPRSAWVCVAGFLVSVAALGTSAGGIFTVRSVSVVGSNLPEATIVQASGVHGQNIFTVGSDRVIDRLASVPSIQVSRVEISFPDQVRIFAQLRRPAIAWQNGKSLVLVDDGGHAIGATQTTKLPTITGGSGPPGSATIVAVEYAARALPLVPDGPVAGYAITDHEGLVITGTSGWSAVVGSGSVEAMVTRVATLIALLKQEAKAQLHLLSADVRYDQPFFRSRP